MRSRDVLAPSGTRSVRGSQSSLIRAPEAGLLEDEASLRASGEHQLPESEAGSPEPPLGPGEAERLADEAITPPSSSRPRTAAERQGSGGASGRPPPPGGPVETDDELLEY